MDEISPTSTKPCIVVDCGCATQNVDSLDWLRQK